MYIYIYVYIYIYMYICIYYTYYMEVSKVMVPQIIQSSWMTYQPFKLGHSDIVRWFSQSESSQWFSPRLRPLRWFNGLVFLGKFTGLSRLSPMILMGNSMVSQFPVKIYRFSLKPIHWISLNGGSWCCLSDSRNFGVPLVRWPWRESRIEISWWCHQKRFLVMSNLHLKIMVVSDYLDVTLEY